MIKDPMFEDLAQDFEGAVSKIEELELTSIRRLHYLKFRSNLYKRLDVVLSKSGSHTEEIDKISDELDSLREALQQSPLKALKEHDVLVCDV